MKDKALETFYKWDLEKLDGYLDKDEFKKILGEDNDEILDPIIRDLRDEGLIEIMQTVGSYWKAGRIAPEGRLRFPLPYSDDMKPLILHTLRKFDYRNLNQYLDKQRLKKLVEEDNDDIINRVLRDFDYAYYIETSSLAQDKWQSVRITKLGREFLEEQNI